jgi:hypothetical protein
MRSEPRTTSIAVWPALPLGGVFPELLTSVEVAQLLRYDADGTSVERAKRNVQWLVRNRGLPIFSKLGQKYIFRKTDVLSWLGNRCGEYHRHEAPSSDHPHVLPQPNET